MIASARRRPQCCRGPHQVRAFERLYQRWPPRLLIADEVGLGKTIEAGLLLRQAWLSGRAQRILVLAPKAVLAQWQAELREKFNLNWPIYDGYSLTSQPSQVLFTRELLRHYRDAGRLHSRIADRDVVDAFVDLTSEERMVYEAIEAYISQTYDKASKKERNAVGFVMTVYRRRLGQ